jgi:hypothetical protein
MPLVKLNGIAVASIIKLNGIAASSIEKWNGIEWVTGTEEVFSPAANGDDGHCIDDESGFSNSTDMLIIGDVGGDNYYAFIRFTGVDVIPHWAKISSAVITLTAYATNAQTVCRLMYQIQYNDDDAPTNGDEIVNADRISDVVEVDGEETWVDGNIYQSPDLSVLLQDALNSPAWPYDGGGVVFHIWDNPDAGSSDDARRQISSFDFASAGEKAVLNITWYWQNIWWSDYMGVLTTFNHYGSGTVTQETFGGEETFKFDSYPSSYIDSFAKLGTRGDYVFGGDLIVAEIRLYIDQFDNAPWDDITFQVIDAHDHILNVKIAGDDRKVVIYNGSAWVETGITMSLDTWTTLKFVQNLSSGWASATTDVYKDGDKIGDDIDCSAESTGNSAAVAFHTDGGVVVYVDFIDVRATF